VFLNICLSRILRAKLQNQHGLALSGTDHLVKYAYSGLNSMNGTYMIDASWKCEIFVLAAREVHCFKT
jgi:hypothetical protein